MLTYDDEPTIRFAIDRRLSKEPGVRHLEIHIKPRFADIPPHIRVATRAQLGETIKNVKSRFDLPIPFEYSHLLNEIDEIAEQYKDARRSFFANGGVPMGIEIEVKGTGVRGRWKKYG